MTPTEQQLLDEITGLERLIGDWGSSDDPQTQWALYLLGVSLDRRRAELRRLRIQPKTIIPHPTTGAASTLCCKDRAPEQPSNLADSKQAAVDVRTMKVVRYFSVKPMACLPLKGRWLERAGFVTGNQVRVCVQHKRLVITVVEAEPPG